MERLVWAGSGEPAWAAGGTYQIVRVIRMHVEFWDRVGLTEQQNMIGRERASGAPLGGPTSSRTLATTSTRDGKRVPLTAHIRLANPRTPRPQISASCVVASTTRAGSTRPGALDQGLVFVAFNQSPQRQFETVQQRLLSEPMIDYITPVGGGYFFAPPGSTSETDSVGSGLFDPAASADG